MRYQLSKFLLKHFKLIVIVFFGIIMLSAPLVFCLYLGFWIGRWTKGLRVIRDKELEEIQRKVIHDAIMHSGPQVSEADRIEDVPAVDTSAYPESEPVEGETQAEVSESNSGETEAENSEQESEEDRLIYQRDEGENGI